MLAFNRTDGVLGLSVDSALVTFPLNASRTISKLIEDHVMPAAFESMGDAETWIQMTRLRRGQHRDFAHRLILALCKISRPTIATGE